MLKKLYQQLLLLYGHQGWWPLLDCKGTNPTKTGSLQGYHPGDYTYPKNDQQQFEICVGAILTQNTNWVNVEKALCNLNVLKALTSQSLQRLNEEKLKQAIRPAGYFNQKTRKLRAFSTFYTTLSGQTPSREALLDIWGIGPETADSILLYAYNIPTFVVDAYTRRILIHLNLISANATYDAVKSLFESSLEPSPQIYQEYHALLVEHAKRLFSHFSCERAIASELKK